MRGLAARQKLPRVLRRAVHANLEMQHGLIAVVTAHLRQPLTGCNPLPLADQPFAVVRIGAEHPVAVFDNDQFAIADQTVAAVDHFTRSSGDDRLAFLPTDLDAVARLLLPHFLKHVGLQDAAIVTGTAELPDIILAGG